MRAHRPPDFDAITGPEPGRAPTPTRQPPPTTRLDPGVTLASRYRIVSQLGKGGMGEVYRADDLELSTPVALKFLPPSLAADQRRAWTGPCPGSPDLPLHVEGAALQRRPVYFALRYPWDLEAAPEVERPRGEYLDTAVRALMLTVSAVLGVRNLRLRRGDRRVGRLGRRQGVFPRARGPRAPLLRDPVGSSRDARRSIGARRSAGNPSRGCEGATTR